MESQAKAWLCKQRSGPAMLHAGWSETETREVSCAAPYPVRQQDWAWQGGTGRAGSDAQM